MKNNRIIAILSAFALQFLHAQTFQLGKVTKAELAEKQHPKEPGAAAAVLFEDGKSYMEFNQTNGFSMVTQTDVRIKIYTKEGYDWANKSITYWTGSNPTEHVDISKAVTYNLINGEIETTKLKSDGEFDEKSNKYYSRKKISMPNVREGSVVEYRVTLSSPFLADVPQWYFQQTIPVNYSHYQTAFPEYYEYKSNLRGSIMPKILHLSNQKSISVTSTQRTGNLVTSSSFSTDHLDYHEIVTDYTVTDAPSMKDEGYVNNITNYVTMVEHELSVIRKPNAIPNYVSSTWEDVVKNIYQNEDFGPELKKNGYFESDLPAVIAGLSDNASRTAAIFQFVKQNMNWNQFTGYVCDDGVRKAYKSKVGNVAEINLILTAMLRAAGVDANPVLLSTRANGVAFFPNRTAYNYVICGAKINGNIVLLDATDKNALPGILPPRALNWFGRMIREDGTSDDIDLAPTSHSKDIVFIVANVNPEGNITGQLREQYYDYNAFSYRSLNAPSAQETYLEKIEQKHPGLEISDFSVSRDDVSKPVTESYAFSHGGSTEMIGGKMYLSPLVFFTENENPFKQEKREYPVDFGFPHENKLNITVNLPDGFQVESLPTPAAVTMPEEMGKFVYNIVASGKTIQVQCVLDINKAIFSAMDYDVLKDFYGLYIEKQREKIILKKI